MVAVIHHLKKLDWVLLGAIALAFVLGLLTLYGDAQSRTLFFKQAVFGLAGLAIIIAFSFFDWRILKNNSFLLFGLYAAGVFVLFMLFVVGQEVRGVVSWFRIGLLGFEPVELVKIILILVLAKYFSNRHIELYKWKNIAVSALYTALPAALVLLQPDLGSAVTLLVAWLGLVLISGIKAKQFLAIILIAIAAAGLLWSYGLKDYQQNRVINFLYPERDPLGGSYQTKQAITAIGSGGLWGKGIGQGTQARLGFLPEYQTDFIFAAIAEEWGLLGVAMLLGAWSLIFWRLYKNFVWAGDNFSRLFVAGIILVLGAHFLINIGTNLGLLPVTGLPLTFVSSGGSNLLSLALGIGLVQAIFTRSFRKSFGHSQVFLADE